MAIHTDNDKPTVETANSCPVCGGTSQYSDENGQKKCKTCAVGHFGVVVSGSRGHKACDNHKCVSRTKLPANSKSVVAKDPYTWFTWYVVNLEVA